MDPLPTATHLDPLLSEPKSQQQALLPSSYQVHLPRYGVINFLIAGVITRESFPLNPGGESTSLILPPELRSGVRNGSPDPRAARQRDPERARPIHMASSARLLALLAVLVLAAARGADALRSLGVGEDAAAVAQGDAAVDLNATTFDAFLGAAREPFAVVEFFAHWCPACRNYKPHYEKVAKLFNGQDAAHPGRVLMARVDCALKVQYF
ncbi:hypothetical protein ACQ4PT_039915 [Festuca glaucescens]